MKIRLWFSYKFYLFRKYLIRMFYNVRIPYKFLDFLRWKVIDIYESVKKGKVFNEYGLTFFCGRQGSGKTISMVKYLNEMRFLYPDVLIYTNFGYTGQDGEMQDWRDLLNIRNGEKGVIFAIDEIQNEYNSNSWKDFPEDLLREITQQRKQRIKIIASSQVYGRVVKQLREQAFEIVECRCVAGRWVFLKCFDADDYDMYYNSISSENRFKIRRKWRKSFVQNNDIRGQYDSYKKIESMRYKTYIPRNERCN